MAFYSYRETKQHTINGLPVAYYNVNSHHPRYEMMHHWHSEYELLRVKRGWLRLTLDGESFFLKQGDTVLINSGVIHSARPTDAEYECLVFGLEHIIRQYLAIYPEGKALLGGEKQIPPFITRQSPKAQGLADRLFTALEDRRSGYELEFISCVSGFLAEVIASGLTYKTDSAAPAHTARFKAFERAVAFIESNYNRPVTLQELAQAAGISRKYFSEYFKKLCGKSPIEQLNRYRIEKACEMLIDSDAPVTDVALDCGFNDLSYFIKTFKRQKGLTPAAYRRENI